MVTTQQQPSMVQMQPVAWPGSVALVAKPGGAHTGVGRYVYMLHAGLRAAGVDAVRVAPSLPPLTGVGYTMLRKLGLDARAFFGTYPVWAQYPRADVYHLTSQNLASLLLFRRPPGKVVVTVHDIIPYMLRNDPQLSSYHSAADRLFDRMAMAGLRRADQLIAVSHYTKRTVVEHLGIAAAKLDVIHEGIDHTRFRPLDVPPTIRARYGLPANRRYLIYVGSEDPRKNLEVLVRALADLRWALPDVELIKVGRAHFDAERQKLLALAGELGVADAIHWLDDVPEEDLPALYNLADVCVMPSLYEGFGFPVIEAMACGTPVVVANASSLPELAGDAALLFQPNDSRELVAKIVTTLCPPVQREQMRSIALQRAQAFGSMRDIDSTLLNYRKLLDQCRC